MSRRSFSEGVFLRHALRELDVNVFDGEFTGDAAGESKVKSGADNVVALPRLLELQQLTLKVIGWDEKRLVIKQLACTRDATTPPILILGWHN
ncbi:MAG: hypothetical protein O2960_08670 [Verrucomicrobia bacterium]|nr:hypothetical protein [Verrucomicrobiota bacterium]